MKALFILSIVVPVSLLTTLRLTGILQKTTAVTETNTLELVKWEFQRPTQTVDILKKVDATFTNDELSANMYTLILSYSNNSQFGDDNDYLRMAMVINTTATNRKVSVENIYVVFHEDSQPSLVDWLETSFKFENLTLASVSSGWTREEDYKAAYVRLTGANHPNKICISALVEWSFLTLKTKTHEMEVAFELTYYNGTVYKKIIQPFQLEILGR